MTECVRVRNGDVELAVDVAGPRAGPTVLFLHAGGETRQVWSPIARHVSEHGWRTVAPDARGHGESGHSDVYSLPDLLSDAEVVCNRLCGDPLVVVGGSIGGAVGLILAGEKRVPMSALVLLDVPTRPSGESARFERDRIVEAQRRGSPLLSSLDTKMVTGPFVESVIAEFDRWSEAARQVDIPVLLLRGDRSHAVQPWQVEAAREDIARIRVEDLPCGHLVARDCPLEVAQHLTDLCREVAPAASRKGGGGRFSNPG